MKMNFSTYTSCLFILKYLCLHRESTQFEIELVIYPRNTRPLNYLLWLFKKFNIKVKKAGLSEDHVWRNAYSSLISQLDSYDPELTDRACDFKLTSKDIDEIVKKGNLATKDPNETNILLNDLGQNLSFFLDLEKSKPRLQRYLNKQISFFISGQPQKASLEYNKNFYSYSYQKSNFVQNIVNYINKYGSRLVLRELSDIKVFGENTSKVSFLETVLALELEGFIEIEDLEVHDPETYNLKGDRSDLVVAFNVNEKKLKKSSSIGAVSTKAEIIKCGKLIYDLDKCQLSYGNKKTMISPESREIRFLRSLYEKRGMVKEYKDIARDAQLSSYTYYHVDCEYPHEEIKNKDLANDVAMLKRDFRTMVLSLGMPKEEFNSFITTVTKKGYMLNV